MSPSPWDPFLLTTRDLQSCVQQHILGTRGQNEAFISCFQNPRCRLKGSNSLLPKALRSSCAEMNQCAACWGELPHHHPPAMERVGLGKGVGEYIQQAEPGSNWTRVRCLNCPLCRLTLGSPFQPRDWPRPREWWCVKGPEMMLMCRRRERGRSSCSVCMAVWCQAERLLGM